MSRINVDETRKLEVLCKDAKVVEARGCQPVLCASENSYAGIAPQIPIAMLGKGDVCIATAFYSTGHSSPECAVDISKIADCPYRRT